MRPMHPVASILFFLRSRSIARLALIVLLLPQSALAVICSLPNGHVDFCKVCGPCGVWEGDCDGDDQCESGLICSTDVGEDYGFPSSYDVCERPRPCLVPNGHVNFCKVCGPCGVGEGDCDGDGQCRSGLICSTDVGEDYGFPSSFDVCEQPRPCPYPNGHVDYCRKCGLCGVGEGDCDGDDQCESGLICSKDVGEDYGFPSDYDVCESTGDDCSTFQPGPAWCRDCGPCPEGEGDCDGDHECQPGLICAQDVGFYYGWPVKRDVCELP